MVALLLVECGIGAVVVSLSYFVAHGVVGSHYLVLKLEVGIVAGSRIRIHIYDMLCGSAAYEVGNLQSKVFRCYWLVVQ